MLINGCISPRVAFPLGPASFPGAVGGWPMMAAAVDLPPVGSLVSNHLTSCPDRGTGCGRQAGGAHCGRPIPMPPRSNGGTSAAVGFPVTSRSCSRGRPESRGRWSWQLEVMKWAKQVAVEGLGDGVGNCLRSHGGEGLET